jgi:hypothetical protein
MDSYRQIRVEEMPRGGPLLGDVHDPVHLRESAMHRYALRVGRLAGEQLFRELHLWHTNGLQPAGEPDDIADLKIRRPGALRDPLSGQPGELGAGRCRHGRSE